MVLCSDFLSRVNFFNLQGETEITVVNSYLFRTLNNWGEGWYMFWGGAIFPYGPL